MARGTVPTVVANRSLQKAGDSTEPIAALLTDSADTTTPIPKKGWPFGRVINESGGSVTITYFDARTAAGTALTTYSQTGQAVAAQTVPNNSSVELPTALAAVTNLLPVLSSGSATVYFVFER